MGIEFGSDSVGPEEFPEPTMIPTSYVGTEEAQVTFAPPASIKESARQEDRKWVFQMSLLAKMAQQPVGIMALSDGVTSHMVTYESVVKGADDYWVYYVDPWPPERGSFLEAGKNTAGCRATPVEGHTGHWVISAGELFRVLDSAVILSPRTKDDEQQTDDNPSGSG